MEELESYGKINSDATRGEMEKLNPSILRDCSRKEAPLLEEAGLLKYNRSFEHPRVEWFALPAPR